MADSLVKLLFPNQNCHVQSIRLTDSWQQMKASLEAPAPVLRMLGELAAAAALMASGLKFEGALVLQIVGDGPVKLALVEVRSGLKIRATVQMRAGMVVAPNATSKTWSTPMAKAAVRRFSTLSIAAPTKIRTRAWCL